MSERHLFAYRPPMSCPQDGDVYWPDGVPAAHPLDQDVSSCLYIDQNGAEFKICYTFDQIDENVKRNSGWFMPYIPLMTTRGNIYDSN